MAGNEFSASTDSQTIITFIVTANTTGFSAGAIPLYRVSTGSASVSEMEDARNLMFRLGKGGVTPNPNYRFPWSINRQEPVLEGSGVDNNADSSFLRSDATGILNDKGLYTFKDWMDAVMTRFIEISGSALWYSSGISSAPVTSLTLANFFFDSDNGSYINPSSNLNTFIWNQDTGSGALTLQSQGVAISSGRGSVAWQFNYGAITWELGGTFTSNVPGGSRTYSTPTFISGAPVDGGNIYLLFEREVSKGSGNALMWANNIADPTHLTSPSQDVSGQAGDFTGIAIGDYIRKISEGYARYLQVTKMVDGLGGVYTTVGYIADSTISGVELASPIASGASTEPLIYFRSRYSNADIFVDTVVGQYSYTDLNYYWLGRRVGQNFILKNHGTIQPGEKSRIEDSDSINGIDTGSGSSDLMFEHAQYAAFSNASGYQLSQGSGTILTIRRRKRDNTIPSPGPLNTNNDNSYLTYLLVSPIGSMNVGDGLWVKLSDTTGATLTAGNVTDATDDQNDTETTVNVYQVLPYTSSPLRTWDNRDVYLVARCVATNVIQFSDGTMLSTLGRWQETSTEFVSRVQFDSTVNMAALTAQSVLFLDASKNISQDNANFFYNPATPQLGVINYRFGTNTFDIATPADQTWLGNLGQHTLTLGQNNSTVLIPGSLIVQGDSSVINTSSLLVTNKQIVAGVGNINNGGGDSGIAIADNTIPATSGTSTSGQIYLDVLYPSPHGYTVGELVWIDTDVEVGGLTSGEISGPYTFVSSGMAVDTALITSSTSIRLFVDGTATSTQTVTYTGGNTFVSFLTPSSILMSDSSGNTTGMTSWAFQVKGVATTPTITPVSGYGIVPTANSTNFNTGNIPFANADAQGPGGVDTTLNFTSNLNWNNSTMVLTVGGGLSLAGNLTPASDNVYLLGTQALRWETLNVGPGSVNVWQAPTNSTSVVKVALQFSGTTAQLATDSTTPLNITTGSNNGINMDVSGRLGIFNSTNTSTAINITQAVGITTGTSQYGMTISAILSGATSNTGLYVSNQISTATNVNSSAIQVGDNTLLAGATVANQYGLNLGNLTTGTNVYGIYSTISSGATKWFMYSSTGIQSYLGGNLGLGSATTPSTLLHLQSLSSSGNVAATIRRYPVPATPATLTSR